MDRIERILVGTDLSAFAGWAERRAGMLAKHHGAGIDLLHVVGDTLLQALRQALVGSTRELEQLLASLQVELEKTGNGLAQDLGVAVRCRRETGPVVAEIVRVAREGSSQLIVASAHGSHLLHRLVFGSTTERLLYRSPVPLLIVKRSPRSSYRRALIGVDFSPCAQQAVRFARVLLPEAELSLFHAVESPFEGRLQLAGVDAETIARHRVATIAEAQSRMAAFISGVGLERNRVAARVDYGYPIGMLEAAVQQAKPDLLVLGKHGRSLIERWMVGSVTAHMARAARCDVLVVPDSNA